jgi:uncharacterized membrane protein YphA (DoxX/SURF4 family)
MGSGPHIAPFDGSSPLRLQPRVMSPAGKERRSTDADEVKRSARSGGRTETKEPPMAASRGLQSTPRSVRAPSAEAAPGLNAGWHDARYQAFALLRIAFIVAPIAFGVDKFFNILAEWPLYLAPWINDIAPGSGQDFMYLVGAIEILAGVAVAIKPRYGAYVVAGWLAGIVINLLTASGYYDIALRDFGLMLAALTLARLASVYDRPLRTGRAAPRSRDRAA